MPHPDSGEAPAALANSGAALDFLTWWNPNVDPVNNKNTHTKNQRQTSLFIGGVPVEERDLAGVGAVFSGFFSGDLLAF